MSEAMESLWRGGEFEALLVGALRERRMAAEAPAGLEQRLKARLALEAAVQRRPERFAFAEAVRTRRSAASVWSAIGLHAAAIAVVALVVTAGVRAVPGKMVQEAVTLAPPPVLVRPDRMEGGGGAHDVAPAAKGRLPRPAPEQLMPPKAPATVAPQLAVAPTVVLQKDLKMADNAPNLGMPSSALKGLALGMGHGSGIGPGYGNGVGDGTGGNMGGGPMHLGGAIQPPVAIFTPDPEFSEEARKAKFSGNVQVYLWVDEHGNPSHVRVVRGIGMGLDEKAVEAVRQYRFKPATLHGKPVKVDLYVDVDFHIF